MARSWIDQGAEYRGHWAYERPVKHAPPQTKHDAWARDTLDQFIAEYPNHELAPDAQYFRAESFAEEGDADMALNEYARVLELYPNSRRAPTALYKSGLLELRRGNVDDARTFFNRVVQGFPDSDEFELLPYLVTVRNVTTIVISHWRASMYPENRAYILRSADRALHTLNTFGKRPPAAVTREMQQHCGNHD